MHVGLLCAHTHLYKEQVCTNGLVNHQLTFSPSCYVMFFLGVPLIGFGAIVDQKDLNLKGGCTDILGSTDSNTKGHLCIKMAQQPCRLPWDKRQQQLRFSELILKKKGKKPANTNKTKRSIH